MSRLELLAQQLLRDRCPVRFVVTGSSMYPFIREGDTVTLAPCVGTERVGDVVAVSHAGRFFIHRIVRAAETGLWVQGDAHPHTALPVSRHEVWGVVVRIERAGRSATDWGQIGWIRRARRWVGRLVASDKKATPEE